MEQGPEAPKKLNVFANLRPESPLIAPGALAGVAARDVGESPLKVPASEKPLRQFNSVDAAVRAEPLACAARCGLYLQQHCKVGTIKGSHRKPIPGRSLATVPIG
jgi:hypothetical protein